MTRANTLQSRSDSVLTRRDALAAMAAALASGPLMAADPGTVPISNVERSTLKTVTEGVRGPEGPSLLPDGSVAMVEFVVGNIIRVTPEGQRETLCSPGTGIVGTALGRDGALYAVKLDPGKFGPPGQTGGPAPSPGGLVRVDLKTRAVTVLHSTYQGAELKGPDDIVVDRWGDIWFTDVVDRCVYWARADGTSLKRVIADVPGVNGICLSPDHERLYILGNDKLLAYGVSGRGRLRQTAGVALAQELLTLPKGRQPDGMRTEANGNIVGGCWEDGITVYSPSGSIVSRMAIPGVRVISLCFGGPDLRTAYLAALPSDSMTGMLLQMPWPRSGMRLPV